MSVKLCIKSKKKTRSSIDAFIRYKGSRYFIATGESVLSAFWKPEKGRLAEDKRKYPEASEINIRLEKWENTLNRVVNEFSYKMQIPSKEEFKIAVNQELKIIDKSQETFRSYIEEFIPKSGRSDSTKRSYNSTLFNLKNFEDKFQTKLQYTDIDLNFYRNFKAYIEDEGKSKNYFGTLIKNIKLFMDEAKEEGKHDSNEYRNKKFHTVSEAADTVYLNEDELLKIYKLVFSDEAIRKQYKGIISRDIRRKRIVLEKVRNRFLIGTYTALRVSDFSRLSEINLDNNFIRIQPIKGSSVRKNEDIIIPIHWIIKEILEKGFDLSERVHDQKINKYIKEICEMAGLDTLITTSKTIGGSIKEEVNPKYKLITTHTARRSGATNMFNAGIPSIRIMKITGHKTEKAFMKYIRISQEENAKVLANHPYFKKYPEQMENQKYPDYNPDTSEIKFETVQVYRSILVEHYQEHKFDSIKKLNDNLISVYFMTFKSGGKKKTKEEQFKHEMLSTLKDVHREIYDHLNEDD